MELRHLRYFAALAETLNFTRAADRTHVTQSTLSHQIKQLEGELGVQLFDRVGKRVVITEAGDSLLVQLLPALRQIDVAINSLNTSPDSMTGSIRIGATHSFNTQLVPQCIANFHSRHPAIQVTAEELPQDKIVERLELGNLDLGIAYRPEESHELWFEPLYNEEMVLVVNSNHPYAARRKVRMVELHKLKMVLLPQIFSTRRQIDECFRSAGAEPQIVVEMNTVMPMIELVKHTDLACIVGETAVKASDGLIIISLENPTPIRTPGLLWKKGEPEDSAIKRFAAIVRRATKPGTDANCSSEAT